jgi:hypothetical protein
MQWSDVRRPVPPRQLRQFAGLFLAIFGMIAAWRWIDGDRDAWTVALGALAAVVGITGLAHPPAVRPVFTAWMAAAFPIGWTVARVVLAAVFFVVITPIALVFRLAGRDALRLGRPDAGTCWAPKARPSTLREYFRQS